MADLLKRELETYEAQKSELMGQAMGKFVLIKDEEVVGVFDTQMDAIRQGYARFGNAPFLVKQIVQLEIPQNFTSNLGV
jgi:hypothetical protein